MPGQTILKASEDYREIDVYLKEQKIRSIFLVCDEAISFLKIDTYFKELPGRLGVDVYRFMDFQPNPRYESVAEGVRRFREQGSDAIFAVGGGSSMDVAKCIKLYANMEEGKNYLMQPIHANEIPLFAVPTTAGTGSESTKYAVIYYYGEKQSVTHESCIPSTVLMDPTVLKTLPPYQKKSTMLDAFCHAVESFWSVQSTDKSKAYAREAIRLILRNMDSYLDNDDNGNANMLYAAHLAGKAINITQTTAGHAMCYKLTSLYGIAHGHAAALCVNTLWPYMLEHIECCADPRGQCYLNEVFEELGQLMGCTAPHDAPRKWNALLDKLEMAAPLIGNMAELNILSGSVNPVRLKNNPVQLSLPVFEMLYREILSGKHSSQAAESLPGEGTVLPG